MSKSAAILRRSFQNIKQIARREPCFAVTEILITYYCTQRCIQCSIPQRASLVQRLSFENFKKIIDALDRFGTQAVIISGGEPLVHPQWLDCLEYMASKYFGYTHILSTLYASDRKIEELTKILLKHKISITCSFDGIGQIADTLRGAKDVSKIVMEHMDYVASENRALGAPINTGANIVISQMNIHQIPAILEKVEQLGWLASLDLYRPSREFIRNDGDLIIRDTKQLARVIEHAKKSKAVVTPGWILDGYVKYFSADVPKYCPYISSPSLGSRFFVHPDGNVKLCLPGTVGNLIHQTPEEILRSAVWKAKQAEIQNCAGCWNACLTPFAKLSSYRLKDFTDMYAQKRFLSKEHSVLQ